MANLIDNDAKVYTPGVYGYGHPTIVSFDDGTLFAGHINDLGKLEIHKSEDNGSTWVINNTITPSIGSIAFFNLCYRHTVSVDEVFVLYNDGANDYKLQKRDDGGSWSQVLTFSLTASNKKALIRLDKDIDRLQVWWVDDPSGANYKSKYSDNGGSSWSDGANYTSSTILFYLGDFDIDPITNNIVICGQRSDLTAQYYHIFDKDGTYISKTSDGYIGKTYYANVLYDSGGNMSRVRYFFETNVIDIRGRGATNWSATINNLIAGLDGDDNIYVFYTKTSDNKVYYRKYDGSWGSETLLVNTANNKFNCQKHIISSETVLNYMYYTA